MSRKKVKTTTPSGYWLRRPGFNYALGFVDKVYPIRTNSGLQEHSVTPSIKDAKKQSP